MTAGRGEGGGRHARPEPPESADEPQPEAAGQPNAGNSVTQPLPMVRREGLAEEPSPVRAVAKRVASALPALGGDEIPDAPPSARANVDRRRRAREAAAGTSGDADREAPDPVAEGEPDPATDGEHGPGSGSPQGSGSRTAPAPPSSTPPSTAPPSTAPPTAAPAAPSAGPAVRPPAARPTAGETPAQAAFVPRQRPEPAIERSPELVVAASAAGAQPAEVELLPVGIRSHESPIASGGEVVPPPGARPHGSRDAEIVDAEIIDDRGLGRSPVDTTAAEVVTALTHVAFRDARTDEWATGPVGHVGEIAPASHLGEAPPVRSHVGELEPFRGGPGVLESDSWDTTTSLPPVEKGEYQGKRRRDRRKETRAAVVVALVVVALSAVVGLPLLMTGGEPEPEGPPVAADSASRPGLTDPASPATAPSATEGGIPVATAPEASPTPSPDLSPSAGESSGSSPSPSASAVPFVALEAEAASLSGCAQVRTVSDVTVVDRLGESNDWSGCSGHGTVTFRNISLPPGAYRVTVYYVFGLSAEWDESRYARLRIRNVATGGVSDNGNNYPRTTTCCQAWTTPTINVVGGNYDISFTHPGNRSGPDRAPAIDRIEITGV